MNEHEALQFLDQTVAGIATNRAAHVKLQEAVKIIAIALSPTPQENKNG